MIRIFINLRLELKLSSVSSDSEKLALSSGQSVTLVFVVANGTTHGPEDLPARLQASLRAIMSLLSLIILMSLAH